MAYAFPAWCCKVVKPSAHHMINLVSCASDLERGIPSDALLRERWEAMLSKISAGKMSCFPAPP